MTRVAVYLTGGIAIYKAISVIRRLQKDGYDVRVAMTENAKKFVTSQTLAALTKYPVLDNLFDSKREDKILHVELADWSQAALIVPADANVIAKIANGIADDAVTTTLLATAAPKYIVPAMNVHMWENSATQRNIEQLEEDGVNILDPVNGVLAEGYSGKGRMPEPDDIVTWFEKSLINNKILENRKIVVTAGGNLESIDPVRFIGNHSSGKMGIELANEAVKMGAEVTLIYGNISTKLPKESVKLIRAISAQEMLKNVEKEFKNADALIMAAAVSDWRPKKVADHKVKKISGEDEWNLKLVKNPDILKTVATDKNSNQVVVGFAAETDNLIENARKKLDQKHADMIVANDVSKNAFGSDYDKVTILRKDKKDLDLPRMTKKEVSQEILKLVSEELNK